MAEIEDPLHRVMLVANARKMPDDSRGWFADLLCRLVKTYPTFTKDYVLDELPLIEAWIFYDFAIEDDAMNRFGGLKRISKGYVGMEAQSLIDQAHDAWAKEKNGRKT